MSSKGRTLDSTLDMLCYMELREGDVAGNQNIRSSHGVAEYSLIFPTVLPGGRVQFGFSNCPAGRLSPIDKPAEAGLSIGQGRPAGHFEKPNCTRPPSRTVGKIKLYKAAQWEDRIF